MMAQDNPLAAAAGLQLAIDAGLGIQFIHRLATQAASLLQCLPAVEDLDPSRAQRGTLIGIVRTCAGQLGPQVDLGPLRSLAAEHAPQDLERDFELDFDDLYTFLANAPVADAARSTPDLQLTLRSGTVQHENPSYDLAFDDAARFEGVLEESADGLAQRIWISFPLSRTSEAWRLSLEAADGTCSFECRVVPTGTPPKWEGTVFVANHLGRPTLRLTRWDAADAVAEEERLSNTASRLGIEAAEVVTAARTSSSEDDWTNAGHAWQRCARGWADAAANSQIVSLHGSIELESKTNADIERQALALAMAAACYQQAGNGRAAEQRRRDIAELGTFAETVWLDPRWLELSNPGELPAERTCEVLGTLVRTWATRSLRSELGEVVDINPENLVSTCKSHMAILPEDDHKRRLATLLPLAILSMCLGRVSAARDLVTHWVDLDYGVNIDDELNAKLQALKLLVLGED